MAYRMQTSAPELIDLSGEIAADARPVRREAGQAVVRQQLPAGPPAGRARRAVRPALPHRLGPPRQPGPTSANRSTTSAARSTSRAAALVKDLKQRGLLDDTLVVWGGEFGRTPMGEAARQIGRDHHIDAFTMWLAGGGVKPGLSLGETDEFGYYARRGPGPRPRPAGDDPAPAGPRPHEADLPLPGPRLPADRRGGQVVQEDARVGIPCSDYQANIAMTVTKLFDEPRCRRQAALIESIEEALGWDERTMPPAGGEYRAGTDDIHQRPSSSKADRPAAGRGAG